MNAPRPVLDTHAPPARPTWRGALWLALILSLPVGVLGLVAEGLWRLFW